MLSLLVLNGVEPNCYKILDLKEGQTLYLQNDNYPNYGGENIWTWKIHSSVIIKATCYIDLVSLLYKFYLKLGHTYILIRFLSIL